MELILTVIFSALMLPVNLCCSFWLFKETLNLSCLTFSEICWDLSGGLKTAGSMRNTKTKIVLTYLSERSTNPEKTKKLFNLYLFSTLPGLAAAVLASYVGSSQNPDKLKIAFISNIILILINLAIVIAGKIYRKNNPLDERIAEKLAQTRASEKEKGRRLGAKGIIIYLIAGAFFLTIFLGFNVAVAVSTQQRSIAEDVDFHDVNTVLIKRGYETANIPTTYWAFEESKLANVCAGVKGNAKFEYYEYSDSETTDLVYNQIINDIAQNMKPNELDNHEMPLSDGNKMFTVIIDGVYYCVSYKENSVVFAYSTESLDEINAILSEIGYLKNEWT